MKIWFKYLIGILLGIVVSILIPVNMLQSPVNFITEIFIRLGCYILLPLVFSSGLVAVFELADSGIIAKAGLMTVIVIAISSLFLTFTGLFSILVIHLPRIPINIEKISNIEAVNIPDMVRQILPYSAFNSFKEGTFLLPGFLFALILALSCIFDKNESRQVFMLADSFSKVCYRIMTFFMEILSIGMIAIMVSWIISFRTVLASGIFTPLIFMLLGNLVFITLVIYPLVLHFMLRDPHPYRVLYASLAPLFTAFFSGNTNLVLPLVIRHGKDSLGIRRRLNGFTAPMFSIFARGGSALAVTVSFFVIWRSYSSLGIAISDIFWVLGTAFILSFALGALPTGGTYFALAIICTMYGKGIETGYLLLKPAAAIIGSFAAALDAVTAMYGSYIIAVKTKTVHHKEIHHFI